MKKKALILKKEMLKEQFNAEYDEKGASKDFFTQQKEAIASQAATNRSAFADEDPESRVKLEGFRPGASIAFAYNVTFSSHIVPSPRSICSLRV